jgi:urea carboxylase
VYGKYWFSRESTVQAGDTLMLLESMKMEVRVAAALGGTVQAVIVEPGQTVRAGQRLGVIAA